MTATPPDCSCLRRGPRGPTTYVGRDARLADVELAKCPACRRLWLVYRFEQEAFSRSGRWYAGVVGRDDVENLAPETAAALLERLPWHLVGGSYFDGRTSRRSGPLLGL